ncbi:hypothetical protein Pcinc_029674 [Petrolisthes cinctipes]|uniref:Uncharacterized protein n=1 Tax=Petrolisthes cinctipes TaxID=88211 RepID=A0AAE1F0K0_PETCI|nr:hypothetical protein Pcinc_029674 [Petrolisthes cinctipes]
MSTKEIHLTTPLHSPTKSPHSFTPLPNPTERPHSTTPLLDYTHSTRTVQSPHTLYFSVSPSPHFTTICHFHTTITLLLHLSSIHAPDYSTTTTPPPILRIFQRRSIES